MISKNEFYRVSEEIFGLLNNLFVVGTKWRIVLNIVLPELIIDEKLQIGFGILLFVIAQNSEVKETADIHSVQAAAYEFFSNILK